LWLRFDGPLAVARTPLHAAIQSDAFQCVELLLANGASLEVSSPRLRHHRPEFRYYLPLQRHLFCALS
jgi:ankyrin repeat protein